MDIAVYLERNVVIHWNATKLDMVTNVPDQNQVIFTHRLAIDILSIAQKGIWLINWVLIMSIFILLACTQPKRIGVCKAAIKKWYYNNWKKTCEVFYWGGCDPNDNNFPSKQECEETCGRKGITFLNCIPIYTIHC